MNEKPAMTAADLFVLLDREFRRRRSRECTGCVIQLPYRVKATESHRGNWDIDMPQRCGQLGCTEAFEEIVSEFQDLYHLRGESADQSS